MSVALTGPAADRPTLSPPSGPASSKASEVAQERAYGAAASARRTQNVQILQASMEVSIKAGDQSQALLFRSAIDAINQQLAPTLGENAIQNAATSQDNSPDATAERILGFATGFFEAYAAQRKGDDPEQVARDFVSLIRGGFETGFNEARDILTGLGVFSGEVESGVMRTFELVHKGLDDFLAGKLPPKPEEVRAETV